MLVAILLVALGTIIAAAVAYESAMTARRGTATLAFDEAFLVGEGAEALAAFGLKSVLQQSKPGAGSTMPDVYPGQQWAQPVGPFEIVPGTTLEQASLEDMQGRFNLNWLVAASGANPGAANIPGAANTPGISQTPNPSGAASGTGTIPGVAGPDPGAVRAFNKLLELAGLEPKWADLVVDWIDSDNIPQSQGAEDSVYLGQNPPYLAANRYITSITELLALPGFGRENFLKLAPYISALPPASSLNICTAPPQVLDAFSSTQTNWSTDPAGLAKNRETAGGCFPDMQTFRATMDPNDLQAFSKFGTTSSYFRLSSLITIGTAEFNLYSLLYVENGSYMVHPVLRSFSPD